MQLLVTKQHLARHHQMLRRMQCKYLPARSAIRDGQSRCNQDAIICNHMQSGARFEMANQDAIKMQSGARFERYSVVLSGTQWYSVVLSGTQWYSVVLSGTQRYSEVLRGPCTQCEYGAVGGEKEKGG
jgi:hypothetical protein